MNNVDIVREYRFIYRLISFLMDLNFIHKHEQDKRATNETETKTQNETKLKKNLNQNVDFHCVKREEVKCIEKTREARNVMTTTTDRDGGAIV